MKSEISTDALSSMRRPASSKVRMFSKRQSFIAPATRSAAPAREQTLRMVMLNVSSAVAAERAVVNELLLKTSQQVRGKQPKKRKSAAKRFVLARLGGGGGIRTHETTHVA